MRIFPSAATIAKPSTWGNGPAACTAYHRRCWIPTYWKRLKGCGRAQLVMSEAAVGKKTAWAWAVGTFLGAGRLRPGPGSWGSAAAALLWLAAAKGLHLAPAPLGWLTLAAALGAIAIGIPAATIVGRESEGPDPGH